MGYTLYVLFSIPLCQLPFTSRCIAPVATRCSSCLQLLSHQSSSLCLHKPTEPWSRNWQTQLHLLGGNPGNPIEKEWLLLTYQTWITVGYPWIPNIMWSNWIAIHLGLTGAPWSQPPLHTLRERFAQPLTPAICAKMIHFLGAKSREWGNGMNSSKFLGQWFPHKT